jgi:hypothetical protein
MWERTTPTASKTGDVFRVLLVKEAISAAVFVLANDRLEAAEQAVLLMRSGDDWRVVSIRKRRISPLGLFWSYVDKESNVFAFVNGERSECWIWRGWPTGDGYGRFSFEGTEWLAHRLAWTIENGPIPDGLQLDHLCRNRPCVRPEHTEPVTNRENGRRGLGGHINRSKLYCPSGHPYNAANTKVTSDGRRRCILCDRRRMRDYMKRKRLKFKQNRETGEWVPR